MSNTEKSRNYFILAVLLHMLLFTSFSLSLFSRPKPLPYQSSSDSDSNRVLPAYVYHEEKNSPAPDAVERKMAAAATPQFNTPQDNPTDKQNPDSNKGKVEKQDLPSDDVIALKKDEPSKTTPTTQIQPSDKPDTVNQKASKKATGTKNINQNIATKKGIDNLLLKLLSQATAAKLVYPPLAEDFRLRGTVKLKFMLYPDGRVTQVSLVESSGSNILDDAALNTIRQISPVQGVDKYIQAPQFIHAGIIFGDEKTRQFESFS